MFNRTQLSIAVSAALATALVATATDAMAQATATIGSRRGHRLKHQTDRR